MIFFHGNAGNMGQRCVLVRSDRLAAPVEQASQQYHCFRLSNVSGFYHKLNINILLVEYRGYGLSEGSPSEQGLYMDAQAAFDYIMERNDIDRTQIILFGRSLGRCPVDSSASLQNRFAY